MKNKVFIPFAIIILLSLLILLYLTLSKTSNMDFTRSVFSQVDDSKKIVLYFKDDLVDLNKTANYIREYMQSDLCEISSNMDNVNLDIYDTIFIGYFIISDIPSIAYNYLSKNNLNDKDIYLFNLHNGIADISTYNIIKSITSANISINELSINTSLLNENINNKVINWLKELGY